MQQIEAARREIISRAYVEKIGEGAPKPTPDEVKAYYEKHPALFSERRIYSLQEVDIEATPEQVDDAEGGAARRRRPSRLRRLPEDQRLSSSRARRRVRAAEQLPLASVDQFAKMKDGQAIFNARPNGAQVIHLAGSRSQPVDAAAGDARRSSSSCSTSASASSSPTTCRRCAAAAKIEYVGDFAAEASRRRPADAVAPTRRR